MRNREIDPQKGKRLGLLLWAVFLLLTSYYLVKDVYLIAQKSKCSETVTATAKEPVVIESKSNKGKRITKYYKPTLKYSYGGKYYDTTYEFSNTKNLYPAGTSVEIKVDPDDPTVFYIVDDPAAKSNLLEHGLFFMLIGVLPVAIYYFVPWDKKINLGKGADIGAFEIQRRTREKFEMDEAQRREAREVYLAEKRRMADQLWEEQTKPVQQPAEEQQEPLQTKGESS